MADNFSEINSLENFSRGDHQEITESKNHNQSIDLCDTEDEDAQDFETSAVVNNINLEERLRRLQSTMGVLRKQLAEERYMWKKQLDEAMQGTVLHENRLEILGANDIIDIAKETDSSEDIQTHLTNLTKTEYETSLTAYQEDVIKALAEKRANLRRQISINNYKRRLLEVENMCNLELLRVKQSVQFLQPLQMMASEWNSRNTNDHNFLNEETPSVIELQEPSKDYSNAVKVEEAYAVEPSNNRFYNDTVSALFNKPPCFSLQSPQLNSTSATWQVGDDNSTIWY